MTKLALYAITMGMLCCSMQGDPTFNLIPASGAVVASRGDTVGWGISITDNDIGQWTVITGSSYDYPCQGCAVSSSIGTYTDFIGQAFLVLGPGEFTNISEAYNFATQSGAGSLQIGSAAPESSTFNGYVEIDYSTFSVDPNSPAFDPTMDTLNPDAQAYLSAPLTTTPEPSSVMLFAVALLLAALAYRKRLAKSL